MIVRRRPTLPHSHPCSTIGAEWLNFRVRNVTGCFPFAMAAETLLRYQQNLGALLAFKGTVSFSGSRSYLGNLTVDAVDLCKKQALGLLVPVGSMHCCTSTSGLSTQWSAGGLTW